MNDDGLIELVVQFRLRSWGTIEALKMRHEVEDLLHGVLERLEIGYCDGGDIGSGTMTIYCYVTDAESGYSAVIGELEAKGKLAGAIIAVAVDDDYKVLWPEGFSGDFSII